MDHAVMAGPDEPKKYTSNIRDTLLTGLEVLHTKPDPVDDKTDTLIRNDMGNGANIVKAIKIEGDLGKLHHHC